MNRQIRVLGVVMLAAFALLFLQLNNIQVLQSSKLANSSGNVRHVLAMFNQPRGVIQTSDGTVVAKSVPSSGLYKYQRQYPEGSLFAHITGYISLIYGSTGVEAAYSKDLSGHTLPIRALGDLLTNRQVTENVTLTLSNRLQQVAANALTASKVRGSVVVLDPSTGAVLAMYTNPSYDPNPLASHDGATVTNAWKAYQADSGNPMLARAYRRSYAPGSTFKVVTASAVLDHQPSLATKSYPQVTQIGLPNTTHTLHNFADESCGGQLPELLTVSCDTGFAQLGLDLGAQSLSAEADAFGFNQTPPLDLPALASSFPPASAFAHDLPGLAFSAIGQQNVSATALQMALVAAGIANHGVIVGPHVMAEVRDSQGRLVRSWKPAPWVTATSPQTASAVTSMMESVASSPNGTATGVFNIPGVQVAAKTGTAETNTNGGENNWMIAFAPAQSPKVAVAVVVPSQPGLGVNTTGAAVAGPIANTVLSAALGGR